MADPTDPTADEKSVATLSDIDVQEDPVAPSAPSAPATRPTKPQPPDRAWAAFVVMAGVAAIVAIFVVAVVRYKVAADVATATAGASGVIAALVGAYFGIRGATLAQTSTDDVSNPKARHTAP